MSYESAMEAAGAVVHVVEQFGDYQGTAWAKVTHEGNTGWVSYSYGSCSGRDAWEGFRSDFGYNDDLSPIMTQEEAEAAASKNSAWDTEADKVLAFIRVNKVD